MVAIVVTVCCEWLREVVYINKRQPSWLRDLAILADQAEIDVEREGQNSGNQCAGNEVSANLGQLVNLFSVHVFSTKFGYAVGMCPVGYCSI